MIVNESTVKAILRDHMWD